MTLGLVLAIGNGSALGLQTASVVRFDVGLCQNAVRGLDAVTAGPDGSLWFTDPQGGVGRITSDGSSSTCFPLASGANPEGIVTGPDGNLWFVETDGLAPDGVVVGKITPTGTVTTYTPPASSSSFALGANPSDIAAGPDGNLWFTEPGDDQIGQITPTGTITEFSVPTSGGLPWGIAAGSDGNLWFTESTGNQIGRVTTTGAIKEFALPTADSQPAAIAAGPDGNLWFTEMGANQIGRITPTGTITEFPTSAKATSIAAGPDGNLWFTESDDQVGQITPTGTVTELTVPFPVLGITSGPDRKLWMADTQPDASTAFPRDAVERMAAALPPANTSAPSISGTPAVGQTLSCSDGSWANSPTNFSYQWNRDGTQISASTKQTYTVQTADGGHTLACIVTATNAGGSSPVTSDGVAVPASAPTPTPTVTSPTPTITSPTPTPTAAPPALRCTDTSSGKVKIPRAKRHGEPPSSGTLSVHVSCNRTATVRLRARLTGTPHARGRRIKPRTRQYQLRAIDSTIHGGKSAALELKLPEAAASDLQRAAKESVRITLIASNASGTRRTTIRVELAVAA